MGTWLTREWWIRFNFHFEMRSFYGNWVGPPEPEVLEVDVVGPVPDGADRIGVQVEPPVHAHEVDHVAQVVPLKWSLRLCKISYFI